jgi:uncharacterized delta-60 repeat protein
LAIALVALGPGGSALASPGDRDPGFGAGGMADLPFSYTVAMAAEPDGAIVSASPPIGGTTPALSRTTTTGVPDKSFGTDGRLSLPLARNTSAEVDSVAASPSGEIAAAGSTRPEFPTSDAYVARVNPDGTPNAGFGMGGAALIDLGGNETVNSVAFADGDALVVAGVINRFSSSPTPFIARLRPDGSLDPAFAGGAGYLTDLDGDPSTEDDVRALTTLPDGRIEVLSTLSEGPPSYVLRPRVTMLKPNGDLDTSFAGGGIAEVGLDTTTAAQGMARTSSGDTYVFGGRFTAATDHVVELIARLTPSGALDGSFGTSGAIELPMGVTTAVVDGSDRLVVVGTTAEVPQTSTDPPPSDLELLRLGEDGSPDPSFGDGGVVLTDVGQFDSSDSASTALTDPQGRVVVAADFVGENSTATSSRLVRYLPDAGPDDVDGDRVLDGVDACVGRYGAGSADGCPEWRVEGLDVSYERKIDDFDGEISFGPAVACADGAVVNVLRVHKGRDRRVGRAQPAALVRDPLTGRPAYQWSVSSLAPPGRYYARVVPRMIEGFGHCGTLRSAKLRIRHRK